MKQFQTIMVRDVTPQMSQTLNDIMERHNVKTAQKAIEILLREWPDVWQANHTLTKELKDAKNEFAEYRHDTDRALKTLHQTIKTVQDASKVIQSFIHNDEY